MLKFSIKNKKMTKLWPVISGFEMAIFRYENGILMKQPAKFIFSWDLQASMFPQK
jgi:hypothetical protein